MKFSDLETIMSQKGVHSLAEIARYLDTTPQAVSNWKSRDQIPYRIVSIINQTKKNKSSSINMITNSQASPPALFEGSTLSLSDILLTLAEQLKIILVVTFVTIFITFTQVQFTFQPYYTSSAKLFLSGDQPTAGSSGVAGLASQFGINVSKGGTTDLSSPSIYPELVRSVTFAKRILNENFFSEEYQQELSLLAILTHGIDPPSVGLDTLIKKAMLTFQGMVSFDYEGSFSLLTVTASEPVLARDINVKVLDELQKLSRYFKSRNVSERINFIQSRITVVGNDLENSEQRLKIFREQNRQVSSPALQLNEERLSRDINIQKGIFLTLKQQLELANIEKIQDESIVQILDEPQIPLNGSSKELISKILLAGVLGVGLGILLGFLRAYLNNSDIDERKKLRRVKRFVIKKVKDLIMDRRISGIMIILLIISLPTYLGHRSQNPVFFGMYSPKIMLLNMTYLLILFTAIIQFIFLSRKKN